MQFTGTLRTWHDDRGFGFIAPRHGGPEVFVHISAFPRDGSRPTVGEALSYELGRGKDGRPQATRVLRAAIGTPPPPPPPTPSRPAARPRRHQPARASSSWFRSAVMLALVAGVGVYGFKHFQARVPQPPVQAEPNHEPQRQVQAQPAPPATRTESTSRYRCDGRTMCSQMTSCEEATWFLRNCPGTKMDGNHDGIPCERQWCGH